MTTTKTKSGTPEKEGTNVFGRAKNHVRNVYNELRKVHWPNRRQLLGYSAVVFMAVVICAIVIWIYDIGISFVLERIHNLVN